MRRVLRDPGNSGAAPATVSESRRGIRPLCSEHGKAAARDEAIRDHHRAGKPIVAECGGMLYLLEALTDQARKYASMVGLLPGEAIMQGKLANLGLHSLELEGGRRVRGHSFHHSRLSTSLTPAAMSLPARADRYPEPVFRIGRLHASYLHLYFPSNPGACARLFIS